MKRCRKCHQLYKDQTLDFCLEDGTRLFFDANGEETETPTVVLSDANKQASGKLPDTIFPVRSESLVFDRTAPAKTAASPVLLREKVVRQSDKILEIASLVFALSHNWWQWLYLNNQSYSTFTNYFLSANFLIWLLLLVMTAVSSLLSLKRSPNKKFAVVGLVVSAINLILYLVPKR